MKRLLLVLLMLMALAGAGAMVVSAQSPSVSLPGQGTAQVTTGRNGYGKITAFKPAGSWQQSGGPADARALSKPFRPLALPVFGVDINMGSGNETVIASNPANPLNFLVGANNTARFTTTDGGLTW